MQLIVTRPEAQARAFVRELQQRRVAASALPLLAIEPVAAGEELQGHWATLPKRRLVMFVSANAVLHFFAAAAAAAASGANVGPAAGAWPPQTLAGSTGPGTTAALFAAGVPTSCLREPAPDAPRLDSEALWQQLQRERWLGRRVLIVRGDGGRDWLADTLRAAGATVDVVTAYRRTLPLLSDDERVLLAAAQAWPAAHAWHFSSSEAAHNLPRLAPGGAWRASAALATHERIGEAARSIGFAHVQVLAPGMEPLMQAWAKLVAALPSTQPPPLGGG